ncbi:MAG: rhomboid family intramembrane serine protease [Algibacter sp.]
MMRISDTVKHLIIINVIMFVGTMFIGEGRMFYDLFSMYYVENSAFKPWQILTHMFMHGNFQHLFFNMLLLFFWGSDLEFVIGRNKFLFIYLSAGLGAVLIPLLIDYVNFNMTLQALIDGGFQESKILETLNSGMYNTGWELVTNEAKVNRFSRIFGTASFGASGAVMGVMAAYAFLFPNREVVLLFFPMPIKIKYLVGGMIGADFVSSLLTGTPLLSSSNVGYSAHVGGALTGFLIIWYWKKTQFNKNRMD